MNLLRFVALHTTAFVLMSTSLSPNAYAEKSMNATSDQSSGGISSFLCKKGESSGIFSFLCKDESKSQQKTENAQELVEKAHVDAPKAQGRAVSLEEEHYKTFVEKEEKPVVRAAQHNTPFDISRGFADVVEKALPSVVNVSTTQIVDPKTKGESNGRIPGGNPFEDLFRDFMIPGMQSEMPRRVQSLGSGFIVRIENEHMYIVTNHHVIADAKKITIFMHDKNEIEASLHASDERTDIAVLKVKVADLLEKNRALKPFEWGEADKSRIGDWVLAIGNPFGLGSSVTSGIISSKGRDLVTAGRGKGGEYVDDFIQHSAQINMGNSGGALLDMNGRVIGINTAIFSPSGGNVGIGFAIPAGVARKTVEQLISFGRTKRGWLGVKIQHAPEEWLEGIGLKGQGDMVVEVTPEGPADKAGVQADDIILEYNGKMISETHRLTRLVGETEIGKTIPMRVYRKGTGDVTLNITIGEYEEAMKEGKLDSASTALGNSKKETLEIMGMKLGSLNDDQIKKGMKGVLLVDRNPLSPAEEAGLIPGDIIEQINQMDVTTPDQLKKLLAEAKASKRKSALLLISRMRGQDRERMFASIKLDDDWKQEEASPALQPKPLPAERTPKASIQKQPETKKPKGIQKSQANAPKQGA